MFEPTNKQELLLHFSHFQADEQLNNYQPSIYPESPAVVEGSYEVEPRRSKSNFTRAEAEIEEEY